MKKILITGSNGLLGQKIVRQWKEEQNFELIATARGENRITEITGFQYESMDITKEENVLEVISKYQPDYVINTAAMTNVDQCEEDQELCLELNVNAVQYLIKACEKTGSFLLHLSTDFIFDGENGPYLETAAPHPLSFYGQSKLDAEELIQKSNIK